MEKRRNERLDGKPIKVFQIEKKKCSENWNEVYYVCVTNNFYKVLAIRVKMKLGRYTMKKIHLRKARCNFNNITLLSSTIMEKYWSILSIKIYFTIYRNCFILRMCIYLRSTMNKLPYFMAHARFTSSTTNRECMANLFPPISGKNEKNLWW